jgi:hypothetical protein
MFSPERFARLARAHFAEHLRGYLWFLAGVLLLEVVVSIMFAVSKTGFTEFNTQAQNGYYFAGLFLFSAIFAGRYFQQMGRRASALLALMRPASGLEKWLLAVVTTLVLFPMVYTLVYYLVVIPDALIAYSQAQDHAQSAAAEYLRHPVGDKPAAFKPSDYALFRPWDAFKTWREGTAICLWLLFVQGFAMFGSLYFRTVPFIKTLLAALLFLLLSALFVAWAGGDDNLVMNYWTASRPLAPWQKWTYGMLWFLVPSMLWVSSYLAIREREITA